MNKPLLHNIVMEQNREKMKRNEKYSPIQYLVLFLLASVCIVLEIAVFSILSIEFIARHRQALLFLACLITVMLLIVGVIYACKGRATVYRLILSIYGLTIFFLSVLWIAESFGLIAILRDPDRYERFLKEWGILLPVVYILLQVVQVLFLPVPILFSVLTGLRLFGLFGTILYVFIGVFCGSVIAFLIGRKWGNKGVSWLVGAEKLNSWQAKLRGKDSILLAAMFLLPFFPDDLLCLLAGLSTITLSRFLLMMSCTRAISVIGICLSIEFLPLNTWWGIAAWVGIILVLGIAFLVIYKRMGKANNQVRNNEKND